MADGTCRRPNAERRFTWSKIDGDGVVTYRLFRRSLHRRVHMHTDTFPTTMPKGEIARRLKAMRRRLLDEVDEVDLRYLGLSEDVAA